MGLGGSSLKGRSLAWYPCVNTTTAHLQAPLPRLSKKGKPRMADKPEHPATIITAADVIAEKAASAVDGTEPNITPTNLGNAVAPPDAPGPLGPLITAQPVATGATGATTTDEPEPADEPPL